MSTFARIEQPEPLYPGAPVLLRRFKRADEPGDVRVQDHVSVNVEGHRFKVCQFVPGVVECSPGDTPKVWPEVHQYVATWEEACEVFDRYCAAVRSAGWIEIEDDPYGG